MCIVKRIKKAKKIPLNTLLTEEYSTHREPAPMQTPYYGWEWLGMARIYIEMTGNGKKEKKNCGTPAQLGNI